MEAFTRLSGIAAPLPIPNVDTDQIVPKQFLKTIERTGIARALFYDHRFDPDGRVNPSFILNRPPYDKAAILVAGDNFGCGSSREHAPWALLDFGIRCIIAPSFAEIFRNNCINNGLLTVALPADTVKALVAEATSTPTHFTVDLEARTISTSRGMSICFSIDPATRAKLLAGCDAIDETMAKTAEIVVLENKLTNMMPWLPAKQAGYC
ncbi:MAG: 3-isopropylmalate dehydratase small subunit [Sphingomonadaceae bacterium]